MCFFSLRNQIHRPEHLFGDSGVMATFLGIASLFILPQTVHVNVFSPSAFSSHLLQCFAIRSAGNLYFIITILQKKELSESLVFRTIPYHFPIILPSFRLLIRSAPFSPQRQNRSCGYALQGFLLQSGLLHSFSLGSGQGRTVQCLSVSPPPPGHKP